MVPQAFDFRPPSRWQRFKIALRDWWNHIRISWRIHNGYLAHDLEPIKCPRCHHKGPMKEIIKGTCGDGVVAEKDCHCPKCKTYLGSWAYGHWQPPFY